MAVKPAEPFSKSRIYGCEKFKELFKEKPLKIPTLKTESLEDLILILSDVIAMQIDSMKLNSRPSTADVSTSSKLLEDLSTIGWQNIIKADHKSGHFVFRLDEKYALSCASVNGSYKCSIEPLSGDFRDHIFPTLIAAYDQARSQLSALSDYYTLIKHLSELFHVNELEDGRVEVFKSAGSWVTLKFDPLNLLQKPTSEGPDLVWDVTIDITENMGRNFPLASEMGSLECGVCSSTTDSNGNWPDYNCSSGDCNQPFHRACLMEWFLADPRSIKSFGQTHGVCPFCEHTNVLEM